MEELQLVLKLRAWHPLCAVHELKASQFYKMLNLHVNYQVVLPCTIMEGISKTFGAINMKLQEYDAICPNIIALCKNGVPKNFYFKGHFDKKRNTDDRRARPFLLDDICNSELRNLDRLP